MYLCVLIPIMSNNNNGYYMSYHSFIEEQKQKKKKREEKENNNRGENMFICCFCIKQSIYVFFSLKLKSQWRIKVFLQVVTWSLLIFYFLDEFMFTEIFIWCFLCYTKHMCVFFFVNTKITVKDYGFSLLCDIITITRCYSLWY